MANRFRAASCALLVLCATGARVEADGAPPETDSFPTPPKPRMGRLEIRGNVHTRDDVIREDLGIGFGTLISSRRLRAAEGRLLIRHCWKFAWWRGERPRV